MRQRRCNSALAHLPHLAISGSTLSESSVAFRIRWARQVLSLSYPFLIDPVAVADQDAHPVLDERLKGFFRSFRMDHEKGNRCIGHHPKPLQFFFWR